jgi:anti-sigma factor RsiW
MSEPRDKHPSDETLQAYLDDVVSPRERRRIETHVASCARCTEEIAGWSLLFEDLGALTKHGPSPDFQARVMAGVTLPEALPWAARVKARFAALLPARPEHLGSDLLQDLADGALTGRQAARARAHLDACDVCAQEMRGWTAVMSRVSDLNRLAPREGFADRVMAGLAVATAPAVVRVPAWRRALAVGARFVPKTRRAWAALAGASVTPAVTFGLVLYTVFSHPTLTPQALASFVFWQLTELTVTAWGGLVSGGLALVRLAGLDGLLQTVLDAPVMVAGGVAIYALASVLALRVLYKNLIARRSLGHRYASAASAS